MSTLGGVAGEEGGAAKGVVGEANTIAEEVRVVVTQESEKAFQEKTKELFIYAEKHPESAQHALEATENGMKTE